ncbi:MAG: hypothetical protein EHM46_06655 [Bacteroidetes bacterium]|nr:MAG: hypothetical protein EHM46_06655 [Bacteroidota bacterium]
MRVVPFILPVLVLISCTPADTCDEPTESLLVVRFKTSGPPVADTIIQDLTIFGIDESGSRGLVPVNFPGTRLPLDPQHSFTRFVMNSDGISDTIELLHTVESYLVSYGCGFALRYRVTGKSHKGLLIDSLEITGPVVDADILTDEENIRIYF